VTLLTLTPTAQPRSGAAVNLTTLLAAGTLGANTGVSFSNTGREVLYVQQASSASTIIVAVGTLIEGEAVTSITIAGVASDIQFVGPFDTVEDQPGGNLIQVTFGTPANVSGVALIQNAGAF
jgi:hypothetical protein